jgi:hypothetical protein
LKRKDSTAQAENASIVVKYCKKCKMKAKFASSGLFRVNANRKNLDVWLIYKCIKCNTTWNLTVLSRVTTGSIPQDLLTGFHENDIELAKHYASDVALIKRSGAEPLVESKIKQ